MKLTDKQADYLFLTLNGSNDYLLHMNGKEEIKLWYKDITHCIMKTSVFPKEESGLQLYYKNEFKDRKITNYKELQDIVKNTDDWRLVDDDGYTIDMYSGISTNVMILGKSRVVDFNLECIDSLKRIFNHKRKACINKTIQLIEEKIQYLEKEIEELKKSQCLTKFFKENTIEL